MNYWIAPGLISAPESVDVNVVRKIIEEYASIDLTEKTRREDVVFYKHIWRYILYWHTELNVIKASKQCGINHATFLHSLGEVSKNSYDVKYRNIVKRLVLKCYEQGGIESYIPIKNGATSNNLKKQPIDYNQKEFIKFR